MPVQPTDFRLTFTGPDFMWMGERRPGLPFLRWPDGTLCQPVITYFGYSDEVKRVRPSSMKPEAYAIREWLAFLANQRRRWDEADDLLLSMWRESHRTAVENGAIEARQVERKLNCVFDFYRLLPEALPLDERGEPRRPFVGPASRRDRAPCPITSRVVISPGEAAREMWSGSERTGKATAKRPTPGDVEVGSILTWLRAKGERSSSRRAAPGARDLTRLEAERNWLAGRCMVDGGLRAEEVANLTVDAIAKALRNASVPVSLDARQGAKEAVHALDGMSGAPDAQAALLAALDALEAKHRRSIYVEIVGKGRKNRNAPFSIDLVRDLLQVGVWTVRHAQVGAWTESDPRFRAPRQILLSFKTKAAMKPGTVSDLMKDAFSALGIEGSGHRLRAHYATATAARLWDECFALNGYRFDQTVVNMALDRLAEALGHSKVTTTVRYYLDMALLRHFGAANREKLDAVRLVWDAVVRSQGALSEEKMRLIMRVVDGLAAAPDESGLQDVIAMALDDPDLNPAPKAPEPTRKKPALRLVDGSEHP